MQAAPLVLKGVQLGCEHYTKVWDPVKQKYRTLKESDTADPQVVDARIMEEKGYVLRKRSEVRPNEEIVEVVKHRGQVLPRRPRTNRRSSSYDGDYHSSSRTYRRDAGGYGSESEGSVPPSSSNRTRNPRPRQRPRARSQSGRSRRDRSSCSTSSTTSSSQLGSTTEEEEECRKIGRKKWITAGLATVATVHAASKLYSSIENHDKRIIEVERGHMSPEEAHKRARAARWQDAAAISIAALGIKGAMSEWKDMKESNDQHKELLEKHEEHHLRRLEHERRKKAREADGYYKGRDGNWYYVEPKREGSKAGERKTIEGPAEKGRSRSVYDNDERRKSRGPSPATSRRVSTWDDGYDGRRRQR